MLAARSREKRYRADDHIRALTAPLALTTARVATPRDGDDCCSGSPSDRGNDVASHEPHVVGATSVVRRARTADTTADNWVRSLFEGKAARLVTVAMANKTARIVWAVLARGKTYRSPAAI